MEEAGLYVIQKEDLHRMGDIAGDAYSDYPLYRWIFNNCYDADDASSIMMAIISSLFDNAVICAPDESIEGFSVWVPPGFNGSRFIPFIKNGGLNIRSRNKISIYKKLIDYESFAMGLKFKYTDNKDWYLFNVCVGKSSQGKGLGSRLLRPMLKYLDDINGIAYLETNGEWNVPLYKHYGFRLAEWTYIPNSDVKHFVMIRSPMMYSL